MRRQESVKLQPASKGLYEVITAFNCLLGGATLNGRDDSYDYYIKNRKSFGEKKKKLLFLCCAAILVFTLYLALVKEVEVVDGERKQKYRTFSSTVEEFIEEKELQVEPEDIVIPSRERHLQDGSTIYLERGSPVTIQLEEETKEVVTHAVTVEGLLQEQEINLGEEDRVVPPLKEKISDGEKVKVVNLNRQEKEYIIEEEEMPYSTLKIANPSLKKGEKKVIEEGKAGLRENKIQVVFNEGEEILREKVSSAVAEEPVDRIIEYGGDENISRGEKNLEYEEVLKVEATAYCPGTPASKCPINSTGASECTGYYNDGRTFTGKEAVAGEGTLKNPHIVAVDPSIIPLKSLLYVEGLGFAKAEDTGSAIKGKIIDVLFDYHSQAKKFGRQEKKVYILE